MEWLNTRTMDLQRTKNMLERGREVKIAAFGDSLTYGWMVGKGFIEFLEDMLLDKYPAAKINMLNLGLPGGTAREGMFRLQPQVINESPDLVMIQFALNDGLQGYTAEDFFNSMEFIVSSIKKKNQNADILLLTSPLVYDEALQKLAAVYYEQIVLLGQKENIPVARVDLYWQEKINGGVNHRKLVQGDLAHPTEEGHRLMAEAVAAMFN